jgi:hypothetical protein
MARWLSCLLLGGVLLSCLHGCGGSDAPKKLGEPLPSSRFPHQKGPKK